MTTVQKVVGLDSGDMKDDRVLDIARNVRDHAEHLYRCREALCSEAVLLALNKAFSGGLAKEQTVSLAAGFAMGMGESGCLCGAVGGGALALGLLLGKGPGAVKRSEIRHSVRQLHAEFKKAHRSTCCRVLSKPVKHNAKAHFDQCVGLTGDAAEWAARLLLERRPEWRDLIGTALGTRPVKPCGWWRRTINRLRP